MTEKPRVTYSEKLRDPRWQKRRLKILERDEFRCQGCSSASKTLHVHHRYYESGKEPWEYADEALVTVCEDCHEQERSGRRDIEDELIEHLRRTLVVFDLELLVAALKRQPPEFLRSLAHTESNPGQWLVFAEHVNHEVEAYHEFCRRVERGDPPE